MKFAYTQADGTAAFVIAAPAPTRPDGLGGFVVMSEEEWAKIVVGRLPPEATDVVQLPDDWTPPDVDRTFRDAWTHDGGKFTVDMVKARNLHRNTIRAARAPLLAALDVAYDVADEKADATAKTSVAQRKQALRDAPADPAIEAATTPDELRAVWPSVLVAK